MGLHTILIHVSLLNFVKPIMMCSIKSSIVKISLSENQARVSIPIYFQARIKQDCQLFSSYQARIKQDTSCQWRLNQDRDESFDTKKLKIKNFKQVLLFSDGRQCMEDNAWNAMHGRQCMEGNACNIMHGLQFMEWNILH